MEIDRFLDGLADYPSSAGVTNPYRATYAVNNLRLYLKYMQGEAGSRFLFVGEAPGYKGCAITGIPFTSGNIFSCVEHPLLRAIKDRIEVPRRESESTATMVWEYLSTKHVTPLLWNSFPFHPHHADCRSSNRSPTGAELRVGVSFLQQLVDLYKPTIVAAIGAKGLRGLRLAFPGREFKCIRHPSHGGRSDFIIGMDEVIEPRLPPTDTAL